MKRKMPAILIIILLSLLIFLYLGNNWITVTRIYLNYSNLEESFDGFKILQLSDLHNKEFGRESSDLIGVVRSEKPDIIVITGDLIDSRRYDEKPALELVKQIVGIAPVYYVTGNHEWGSRRYTSLEKALLDSGVKVLRNSSHNVKRGEDAICVAGIDDPLSKGYTYGQKPVMDSEIKKAIDGARGFTILLSHRPELFDLYVSNKIDLILTGHAHGGQIRLPFIGGLYAPGQGFFPKYTSGAHEDNGSVMVVSRGLGNSIMPQRIFNRPEVIVVTLENNQAH